MSEKEKLKSLKDLEIESDIESRIFQNYYKTDKRRFSPPFLLPYYDAVKDIVTKK